MLKQLLKNSSIYSVSNLLSRGIALILVPFYTRVLTPADYGIIDFIAIVAMLAGTIFPLEINQAVGRFYPEAENAAEKKQIGANALYFSFIMLGIFLLLVELLAIPLGNWLYESSDPYGVRVVQAAGISIFAKKMFNVFQCQLQARIEPTKHAIASILFSIVSLGLNVVFILWLKTGVIGVFWAQIIAGTLAALLSFYFARESYTFGFFPAKFREMLRFSLPFVPSGVGLFFLSYVDRLFIKGMLSLSELGLYGIGFRFATIVSVVMGGLTTALTPMIYASFKNEKTRDELAKIFRFFLFVAILIIASLSIFGRELLIILTAPPFYDAVVVIPTLVTATFLSQMYIFTPGLGIAKKTGHLASISIVGGILNVVLNWLLLNWLGIVGAALATMISYLVIFAANMYYSQKFYYVPHRAFVLIRSALFAIPLIALGYHIETGSFLQNVLLKVLILLSILFVLILNRLMEVSEIKFYISKIRNR